MLRHWLLIAGLLSPAFSFASTQTFGPAPGAPGQIQYRFIAATTNSNLVTISILKMPLIQEINDSKDTYLVDGKAYHQRSNSRTLDSYLCVLDPKEIEYPYDKIPVTSDF